MRRQYPCMLLVPAVHSIQYKAAAVLTHVAVPAMHSIQYKVAAVPTVVQYPQCITYGIKQRQYPQCIAYRAANQC